MISQTTRQFGQRGVSLIFALITLVSLMLAAIALVRSVDSGGKILGNIGFQQDATANADIGVSQATTWLSAQTQATLAISATAAYSAASSSRTGYYANTREPFDATGQQLTSATEVVTRQLVDWDLDGACTGYATGTVTAGTCNIVPHDVDLSGASVGAGTTARYVILRLCSADGTASTGSCSQPLSGSSSGGAGRTSCSQGDCDRLGSSYGQYYRIVVRVVGSRGTTSFTETVVQF